MFMSMVVHFAEFVMMSLMGIMWYRLYVSYMVWKNACAFSSSTSSVIASGNTISFPSEGNDSDYQNVMKVNVNLTRTTTRSPLSQIISDPLEVVKVEQSKNSEAKSIQTEKKSSSILNDYIGEFFSESQTIDIDAYRASTNTIDNDRELTNSLAVKQNGNVTNHDYIKVEPFSVVSDSVKGPSLIEESIPTLNELCDVESDSFITVATINSEIKSSNKVMSDKVVMAMLDEAKLVRFS